MIRSALSFAAGMLLAAAVAAQPAQGDLWEITMKMEIPGMPAPMPPTTQRMCLPKAASDDQLVPRQEQCKVTESRRSGNSHRYKMVCGGKDPMTAEGEITHAKDAYEGRTHMTMKSDGETMQMTSTFSGRKVGSCANPIGR